MKIKHLLWAALPAVLTMAGCQSNEPASPGNEAGPDLSNGGYMAVQLTLPSVPSTRANDNFDDGLESEYKVEDAALLLFKGASEADAVFQSAYLIPEPTKNDINQNTNVTTQYSKVIKINDPGEVIGLRAMVVVNYKKLFTIEGSSLKVNGTNFTGKFSELVAMTTNDGFLDAGGNFFMTNAPLSTIPGDDQNPLVDNLDKVYTLVDVTAANIAEDPEDFDKAGSGKKPCVINVERALAKATLSYADNVTITKAGDNSENPVTLKVAKFEWVLDNTEPSSYIVRNMGDKGYIGLQNVDKYRFVGKVNTTAEAYRTYWCVDPHYAGADGALMTELPYNRITEFAGSDKVGSENPQYCNENVFNVKNQVWNHTTRAILKVTYKVGDATTSTDLFIVNGDKKVFYDDVNKTGAKKYIADDNALKAAYIAANPSATDIDWDNTVKVGYDLDSETGFYIVKSITVGDKTCDLQGTNGAEIFLGNATINVTYAQMRTLMINANTAYQVTRYEGGVAYYQVRFKHFGDDLTPWNTPGSPVDNTANTANAYDNDNAARFLGRYGMVRNNWYDLNISEFRQMGETDIPTLDNTPDDVIEKEQYLKVQINVLSWAKRVQSEIL